MATTGYCTEAAHNSPESCVDGGGEWKATELRAGAPKWDKVEQMSSTDVTMVVCRSSGIRFAVGSAAFVKHEDSAGRSFCIFTCS